jgi:hypothetical protein
MLTNEVIRLYRRFREPHVNGDSVDDGTYRCVSAQGTFTKYYERTRAIEALQKARIVAEFNDRESDDKRPEDIGAVRLIQRDEQESYFDVYGEPDGYEGLNGKRVSAEDERKEIIRLIELNGCVYVAGQFWTGTHWETADSIGMCIYDRPLDPFDNEYVVDIMRSTLVESAKLCSDLEASVKEWEFSC